MSGPLTAVDLTAFVSALGTVAAGAEAVPMDGSRAAWAGAFVTQKSGGGKYYIRADFPTLDAMRAAFDALARTLGQLAPPAAPDHRREGLELAAQFLEGEGQDTLARYVRALLSTT